MINPLNRSLLSRLQQRVYQSPGSTAASLRQSIRAKVSQDVRTGSSEPLEDPVLDGYVSKMCRHAYQFTDADLHHLQKAGFSEDQIFEISVATALSAGTSRLDLVTELLQSTRT